MALNTDQLKNESKSTNNKGGKSEKQPRNSNALAAHQQFESVAKALSATNNNRLGSLLNAVVEERKSSVSQFVDVLEATETGELDLVLIAQEMDSRRQQRGDIPTEFKIETNHGGFGVDLDGSKDCVGLITGFSQAKAIAGV